MQGIEAELGKIDSFVEPEIKRVQMVPTKRLIALVLGGIPIVAIATWVGMPWFFFVYNGLLLFLVFMTFFFGPNLRYLRLRRSMDTVLSVRSRNKVKLEIENEGGFHLSGSIRDEAPGSFEAEGNEGPLSLGPGAVNELNYVMTPPERGREEFQGTFLRLDCPLGLVQKQAELNTIEPVRVYPNVQAVKDFNLLNQQGKLREAGLRRAKIRGVGTEFESLRDYSEGDDYRKLDWKASARRGKLIVREYEVERNQAVMICVDCGRTMMAEIDGIRKLDHVLDSVLLVIQSAISAGDNVGFLAYGADIINYIPPHKGQKQLGRILTAMFGLDATPVYSDAQRAFSYLSQYNKKRSLIINFTAVDHPDQAKEVVAAFGPTARHNIALLANVADPKMKNVMSKPFEQIEDVFLSASALYLMTERRQAATILTSAKINLLEAEPEELSVRLLNYYLDVKRRGKL